MIQFGTAIQSLCDHHAEFVVIGGLAASIHGSARITLDLDICYPRTPANLKRIVMALKPFHPRPREFPPELPFVFDETTLRNATLFTFATDIGDIDLLAEVAGLGTYEDAKKASIEVEAYDRRFPILNLRSLIKTKYAAGRQKDKEGLVDLEALLEASESES